MWNTWSTDLWGSDRETAVERAYALFNDRLRFQEFQARTCTRYLPAPSCRRLSRYGDGFGYLITGYYARAIETRRYFPDQIGSATSWQTPTISSDG